MSVVTRNTYRYTDEADIKYVAVNYKDKILQVFSSKDGSTRVYHDTLEDWIKSVGASSIKDIDTEVSTKCPVNSPIYPVNFPKDRRYKSLMMRIYNFILSYAPDALKKPAVIEVFNNLSTVLDSPSILKYFRVSKGYVKNFAYHHVPTLTDTSVGNYSEYYSPFTNNNFGCFPIQFIKGAYKSAMNECGNEMNIIRDNWCTLYNKAFDPAKKIYTLEPLITKAKQKRDTYVKQIDYLEDNIIKYKSQLYEAHNAAKTLK